MYCERCGTAVNPGMSACPNCGAAIANNQQVNYGQQSQPQIKIAGFLVWSIIELVCLSPIMGLIGIILYCTQLKPAADKGDVEGAKKAKKTLKIILWIGVALGIIGIVVFLFTIAAVLPTVNSSRDIGGTTIDDLDGTSALIESIQNSDDYDYDYDFEDSDWYVNY